MLNSLLLLGSCYNKYKKISILFTIVLIINIFFVQFGHVKIVFFIYNIVLMLAISLFNKKIKNNSIKLISSSFSIIIWSIMVDIACYYIFPLFNSNLSLFGYIMNGIVFNLKYVVINAFILTAINVIEYVYKNVKNKVMTGQHIYAENIMKG